MAIIAPAQQRSMDPFSDHRFSSVINRLSRIISGGNPCILSPGVSFTLDLQDYHTVTIGPGICIKDDVLIHITEDYTVDFSDSDYFLDGSMDAAGDYYVVMAYAYTRSLPAPRAWLRIIKDVVGTYNPTNHIFLGMAVVIWNAGLGRFEVDSITTADTVRGIERPVQSLASNFIVDGGVI